MIKALFTPRFGPLGASAGGSTAGVVLAGGWGLPIFGRFPLAVGFGSGSRRIWAGGATSGPKEMAFGSYPCAQARRTWDASSAGTVVCISPGHGDPLSIEIHAWAGIVVTSMCLSAGGRGLGDSAATGAGAAVALRGGREGGDG